MDQFVRNCLEDIEDQALQESHPEYRSLVNEYREGMLLFTIMEKEVWNRAAEDTAALRTYYEANQTNYRAGERVRARVFASSDSIFTKSILLKECHNLNWLGFPQPVGQWRGV